MAGQINEATQESTGGSADPTAAGPASAPSQERKSGSWLSWLVSDDLPGGALLNVTMLVILAALLFAPFLFPGSKALDVAARICIFIILVASYDLLLGYTGIVSFAHTMFFGIGAYGVAIGCTHYEGSWAGIGWGVLAGLSFSAVLSLLIGLFSLRVRSIFFSMITLAVAFSFQTFASQMSE